MAAKTLVTGGAGFIGSHVVRGLLDQGRDVRVVLAPGESAANLDGLDVELVEADICDAGAVDRAMDGCGVVYHLAAIYAIWMPRRERMYEVNCLGAMNVCWAALRRSVEKLVFTSSIAAVGHRDDGRPADETTAFNHLGRHNDYILTKWLSEEHARTFVREGLPIVFVNPGGPIGPRDKGPTPTGQLILDIANGRIPFNLNTGFGMADVEDIAAGHLAAEARGRVGERYILCAENLTGRELVRQIRRACGLPPAALTLPVRPLIPAGDLLEAVADRIGRAPLFTGDSLRYADHRVFFDNRKAREELGVNFRPVAQAIERSLRWFAEQGYITRRRVLRHIQR
ncbi:MAG: NAD-dependent epimerase/dehydratase family protein [Candidatus Dadabacteria bacterium]|nr:MAG: NAD-dependent epimerase/dehydratase family protein [Candidatus Dadabacteria bacterium]